jgi:histidinol phosphatase-like enzyme (inositol monophosphatase family)
LQWFQSPRLTSERKADGSVVTPIDKKAEEIIRAAIAREFPGDGVLGEEFGETAGTSGFRWILDPIDGTASFVRGIPHFVILIGIEQHNQMIAGVIDAPALGERVAASRGNGAQWTLRTGETRPARVSTTAELSNALIEIGSMGAFHRHGYAELHRNLCLITKRNRGWSDGYAFMLLATGRIDAAIHFNFKPWDLAAPMIVIEEAGGTLTDWAGCRSITITHPLATNSHLHAAFIKQLAARTSCA